MVMPRSRNASGRYVAGATVTTNVLLRVSPEQKLRWEAAARAAGQTLSAWIRALLDERTRKTR